MRLYISGPMTGLPDFNRPAFRAAQRELESLNPIIDVIVENPCDNPAPPAGHGDEGNDWRWYMGHALEQLLKCDGVALLGSWSNSPGACAEHAVAVAAGLPAWPVESWLALAGRAFMAPRRLADQVDIEWYHRRPSKGNRRVFDLVNIREPEAPRMRSVLSWGGDQL